MNCEEVKDLLSVYIDDMLDTETKKQVEQHLASCASCSKETERLKKVVGELGALEKGKAPEDFLQNLHERIQRRSEFERMMSSVFPGKITTQLKLTGVLVTVLMGIAVYIILEPGTGFQPGVREIPLPQPVPVVSPRALSVPQEIPSQTEKIKEMPIPAPVPVVSPKASTVPQETPTAKIKEMLIQEMPEIIPPIEPHKILGQSTHNAPVSLGSKEEEKIRGTEPTDTAEDTVNSVTEQQMPETFGYKVSRGRLEIQKGGSLTQMQSGVSQSVDASTAEQEVQGTDITISLKEKNLFPQLQDRMEKIVTELQGSILSSELDKEKDTHLFVVIIPAQQYPLFIEKIKEFGAIEEATSVSPQVNVADNTVKLYLHIK